jgi:hypothetical protein
MSSRRSLHSRTNGENGKNWEEPGGLNMFAEVQSGAL